MNFFEEVFITGDRYGLCLTIPLVNINLNALYDLKRICMATLNKSFINSKKLPENISPPADHWDNLPDKVLQFGTGVLLRGLPDYFIDKANREGHFNGRVVVVKKSVAVAEIKQTAVLECQGLYVAAHFLLG